MFEYLRAARTRRPSDFGNGAPPALVAAAEDRLGVELPVDYQAFLAEFGWLDSVALSVFGCGPGVPSHLDVVAETLLERSQFAPLIPAHFVAISNDGAGNLTCLDTRRATERDAGTVVFVPHDTAGFEPEFASATFETWVEEQYRVLAEPEGGYRVVTDYCYDFPGTTYRGVARLPALDMDHFVEYALIPDREWWFMSDLALARQLRQIWASLYPDLPLEIIWSHPQEDVPEPGNYGLLGFDVIGPGQQPLLAEAMWDDPSFSPGPNGLFPRRANAKAWANRAAPEAVVWPVYLVE